MKLRLRLRLQLGLGLGLGLGLRLGHNPHPHRYPTSRQPSLQLSAKPWLSSHLSHNPGNHPTSHSPLHPHPTSYSPRKSGTDADTNDEGVRRDESGGCVS